MAVCYSACKRYGGNQSLAVLEAIMLDSSLANAYSVGSGTAVPRNYSYFRLTNRTCFGFQGGIIVR